MHEKDRKQTSSPRITIDLCGSEFRVRLSSGVIKSPEVSSTPITVVCGDGVKKACLLAAAFAIKGHKKSRSLSPVEISSEKSFLEWVVVASGTKKPANVLNNIRAMWNDLDRGIAKGNSRYLEKAQPRLPTKTTEESINCLFKASSVDSVSQLHLQLNSSVLTRDALEKHVRILKVVGLEKLRKEFEAAMKVEKSNRRDIQNRSHLATRPTADESENPSIKNPRSRVSNDDFPITPQIIFGSIGVLFAIIAISWIPYGAEPPTTISVERKSSIREVRAFDIPRSIGNPFQILECQWHLDTPPELVYFSRNEIVVQTVKGETLSSFAPRDAEILVGSTIHMARDITGDGLDEIFVSCFNKERLSIRVYNQNGFELQRFETSGHYEEKDGIPLTVSHNSYLHAHEWIQKPGQGFPKFLAVVRTGHGKQPRSLLCFDGLSTELLWRFDTGPEITAVTLNSTNDRDQTTIQIAANALYNGASGPDGRSDSTSFVAELDLDGNSIWETNVGGPYTNPSIHQLPNERILVQVSSHLGPLETNRPIRLRKLTLDTPEIIESEWDTIPQNAIVLLDPLGKPVNRLHFDSSINGTSSILPTDQGIKVVLPLGNGRLVILNDELTEVHSSRLFKTDHLDAKQTTVSLLGIHDWLGDSQAEIAILLKGKTVHQQNLTSDPSKAPTQATHYQHQILLLDDQLTTIESSEILMEESSQSFLSMLVDCDADGTPEILLAKDQTHIFKIASD